MEHYKLWGPSLRTCFDLVAGTLSTRAMERETMLAARKFAESKIPLMNDPDPSDLSDILFLNYPEDRRASVSWKHRRWSTPSNTGGKHRRTYILELMVVNDGEQRSELQTQAINLRLYCLKKS